MMQNDSDTKNEQLLKNIESKKNQTQIFKKPNHHNIISDKSDATVLENFSRSKSPYSQTTIK